ncbi:DeoR/GlpR family DNA-binding transcription regulator [Yoonia sediminilitoris]|uniref:DeoR family transcriptional regulator n=1 Tax=Yoonia sediminilitoris TaxID=1286148 RepID=A0A2T6K916_9RHOB|nr:DeoR/GlpR family DNA-binding transcription regulator [Yoonia sediminilitoris]PUB11249.1 DeoR family transcriptional regulator [Yoonia sediminilitoris]RCW91065.1 DeoR family transcriptional regulator [Yoonia sediminilitoris]
MDTKNRQALIRQRAQTDGKVIATTLADELGVAVQTIRRDLRALCTDGLLERTHGGAVLPSGVSNIGYGDRRALNRDVKIRIARRTAQLIPDNASLFLNIGTTSEAVAHALHAHRNLMVVTNNLNVANILAQNPGCDVVVAGGSLRRSDGGLVGDLAAIAIDRFKVDFAVIGTSAIDLSGDLLDFDPEEVRVSQQVIKAARATILVADSSKFTRKAPVKVASLAQVAHFITDRIPSEALINQCADWSTSVAFV